ncbi:cupin domain-containing protein [Devosia algicola]|uniref:Cupin domain-containing protein n=1 Tax=Devosia algicola TaxID=3026418 RepID=A0ABY7YKW0_9HYPH|nr:cupin domain-containing protein [Devosia algicola]WDR01941.1 cupin domain-containing protein [Devosia algicola]
MTKTISAIDLTRWQVLLENGAKMRPIQPSAPASAHLAEGRTLAIFDAEHPEDVHPDHWEMHSEGDEFLYLWSGRLVIDLDCANGTHSVTLTPGTGYVVASGLWHRLRLLAPSVLMAITHRTGTQRRKNPE